MNFHGDKFLLGRYCGPSIDIGHALTANILRNNGQQVHRSTYRALTPDELVYPDDIKACDEFDTAIEEKLGPASSAKYFNSDPDIFTPNLDQYEDDDEHQTNMPEVDGITPDEMEFKDGSMRTYSENIIAESMYAQCDEEGHQYLLFGSILDHKIDGHAL